MTGHRFFLAAAAAVLLGTVPAASAAHRTFSITIFRSPHVGHMSRVQSLAHELERAAAELELDARAQSHHFDRAEARALARLERLRHAADRFHAEVESRYREPRYTADEYRNLVRAYNRAANAVEDLHAYGHVYAGFGRIEALMGDLAGYYDRSASRGDRWRDERWREDRWRDDRWRDDRWRD